MTIDSTDICFKNFIKFDLKVIYEAPIIEIITTFNNINGGPTQIGDDGLGTGTHAS